MNDFITQNDVMISIHQYDSLDFDVVLHSCAGEEFTIPDNTYFWFVVRNNYKEEIKVIQKEKHFHFNEVTMPCEEYDAEIGLIFSDGTEQTIASGKMKVIRRLKER